MNVLNFTGNVGGDGELKYTPGGTAVLSFSVAMSSGYGENKKTHWMRCSLFGKRAESLVEHIRKGTSVAVSGEFAPRTWTTSDGVEKTSLDVNVGDVTLMGSKAQGGQSAPKASSQKEPEFEEDIPF